MHIKSIVQGRVYHGTVSTTVPTGYYVTEGAGPNVRRIRRTGDGVFVALLVIVNEKELV